MRKIIFVSRLDADCSLGAYLLCDIANELWKKYRDLQIIIVGGGAEYEKIKSRAVQINRIINHELIITAGNVADPSLYFEKGALFVGVARSALEAMAYGLPVILLGNEGYLGLLDKSKLSLAQGTNFTCRGVPKKSRTRSLSSEFFNEVCRYFELTDAQKDEISAFSLKTVLDKYSAREMAIKTLNFYNKVIIDYQKSHALLSSHRPKIAICGYYGHGNLGDEAILSVLKKKIQENSPNARIYTVGSKNPFGSICALLFADLFIFGGGSLLQNATSNASLFYYLAIINLSRVLAKHTVMLSNGIGPFKSIEIFKPSLMRAVSRAVDSFDFISVRDEDSQRLLQNLLPSRKIYLIRDPALILSQNINRKLKNKTKKNCFVYIPCSGGLKRGKISPCSVARELLRIEKTAGASPIIVLLNPREDFKTAQKIASYLKNVKILIPNTPNELCSFLSRAKFVISERYHGALFGATCGKNTIAISNDPKTHSLCKDLSLFPCQNYKIFNSGGALSGAVMLLENYYPEKTSQIKARVAKYRSETNKKIEKIILNYIHSS